MRRNLILCLTQLFLGSLLGEQRLAAQSVRYFAIPSAVAGPTQIIRGSDGNLWFLQSAFDSQIGRITPAGVITLFPLSNYGGLQGLVTDPDGALWLSASIPSYRLLRITPLGEITEIPVPAGVEPHQKVWGPDGRLWFLTNDNRIGRLSLDGMVQFFSLPEPNRGAAALRIGPEGSLWFVERGLQAIGRMTLAGAITEFPLPQPAGDLVDLTSGPDGNLWFTESTRFDCCGSIGRITPQGVITRFPLPPHGRPPFVVNELGGIAAGPDGNVWFMEGGNIGRGRPVSQRRVGRISTDGTITEFEISTAGDTFSDPPGLITAGPDGALWFTNLWSNRIGRIEPTACAIDSVCVRQDRFRARVRWVAPDGTRGAGEGVRMTDDTGAFWFFQPSNFELVIKVLDGRAINGHFWVFYGSLTNIEFTLDVTDTESGIVKNYFNPQGRLASSADTSAF